MPESSTSGVSGIRGSLRCTACGKTGQVQPPWARPGSGFSLVMEAFVIALCQAMPVAHVARLVGVLRGV